MGYIDIKGNIVIPFGYTTVHEFSNGVILMGKDKKYGLINKQGEIIVPLTSSNFSLNTNNDKRKYRINDTYYDHYGREIKSDKD
ncbi:MAG: WG repeat-containing protein [Tannerellaceae bacterium]|nr:WG repeat-containing protein [Tannerellaceae bacterium]